MLSQHTHTLIIINHSRVQTDNGKKLNLLKCVLRACVSARRSWLLLADWHRSTICLSWRLRRYAPGPQAVPPPCRTMAAFCTRVSKQHVRPHSTDLQTRQAEMSPGRWFSVDKAGVDC